MMFKIYKNSEIQNFSNFQNIQKLQKLRIKENFKRL